jgi:hypothetical protein
MNVSLSSLKASPAKYFELANTVNIIVTRRGKPVGSIVGRKTAKALAVEALIGSADFPPEYDDPSYDKDYEFAREADYSAGGLIICAKKVGADCIVSRDEKFIKAATEVKVVTPGELREQLK